MGENVFIVDAFAAVPFRGNPAAVCILSEPRKTEWMQSVAAELNLSETAFLQRKGENFRLRWFTPKVEVDLCGHATLASAHILWASGLLSPEEEARFYTRSGLLTAVRKGDLIELDLPLEIAAETTVPSEVMRALGVVPKYTGKNRFDYLVEVESEDIVRGIEPDFELLRKVPVRGVIVTSVSSSPEFDFISRYFAPAVGISEDPVTGSAHCCLAPFWGKRLHRNRLVAFQASSRGGVVHIRMSNSRVYLGGIAVTVLRGELQ